MSARARKARGQAVVEAVLGLLVFISILVFAIFFSETLFISLKVQEASASAMWDSTAGHMHDWPTSVGGTGPANSTVSTARASAQQRYADFDGRTNINGSATRTQTFARATNLNVTCSTGSGPSYPGRFSLSYVATRLIYKDNGGMSCQAQATVDAINFPSNFLDTGRKSFNVQNYQNTPLSLCGVGRAMGGSCQGKYEMMIDDWGLAGPGGVAGESDICVMIPNFGGGMGFPCAPNFRYYSMTRILYTESSLLLVASGAATALATAVVGTSPIDEDSFWMSFEGENPLYFMHPIFPNDVFPIFPWPTNPGGASVLMPWYASSYGSRTKCFLGRACN